MACPAALVVGAPAEAPVVHFDDVEGRPGAGAACGAAGAAWLAGAGWWTGSVPPGTPHGTTVIDGPVDSAATGIGALFYLDRLTPGDVVTLTTSRGDTVTYRVYARHVYDKSQGLPPDLFTTTGPPRLVLITCGGPFDAAERSYLDNIAVFAAPQAAG